MDFLDFLFLGLNAEMECTHRDESNDTTFKFSNTLLLPAVTANTAVAAKPRGRGRGIAEPYRGTALSSSSKLCNACVTACPAA